MIVLTLVTTVAAVSSTVDVPGTAALPDNPQGTLGATAPVDAEIDLSSAARIQVTASGYEDPIGWIRNYPDGCCFNAAFVDAQCDPVPLPASYPAERLCDIDPAWPCSTFYPIPRSGETAYNVTGTPGTHASDPLPVPAGAARLLFGHFDSLYWDNSGVMIVETTILPIQVAIDIKPGSDPNAINLGSNGVIPVAILSAPGFDATQVDPATVSLAGSGVAVRGKGKALASEEDVNRDGLLDLVVRVETENLDPAAFEDGQAILTASTFAGQQIQGADEITIVPQ
jgi:hypothetical protein